MPALVSRSSSASVTLCVHRRDAARARAQRRDRLERAAVVGAVGGRLHHHVAREAEPRLHLAIVRDRGVRRRDQRGRRGRIARIVEVHVGVAGAGRRLEPRRAVSCDAMSKTPRSGLPVYGPMPPWLPSRLRSRERRSLHHSPAEESTMAQQRLGIIMNGVTGRMGMNQHLIRSIVAIRGAGRRGAEERRPGDARPDPGRPQRRQGRGARQGARHLALDHRPRRGAEGQEGHAVLRRRHHAASRRAAQEGDEGRQAHLLREAGVRDARRTRSISCAPRRRPASSTAWCRTSCSCRACSSSRC